MNYKSIIRVVGVVIVAVVFCVGCSEKPDEPDDIIHNDTTKNHTGGNSLAGDWSLVSEEPILKNDYTTIGNIHHTLNDYKTCYSFKSSDDLLITEFNKINDFWIESSISAKYRVKGDSVCLRALQNWSGMSGDEYCNNYSISGNTLIISEEIVLTCYDSEMDEVNICGSVLHQMTFVRDSLANARRLLSNVYRQDTALAFTQWMRPSDSGSILFAGKFYGSVYTSNDSYWYTEGTRLTLVELECDKWNENLFDPGFNCDSYSVIQTVTLDYQLTNGTLRLKAPDKDWDTWTFGSKF
jgi:hypothetical protein